MNLFADETKDYLRELGFQEDWIEVLSQFLSIETIQDILNKVKKERETKVIFPSEENVFRLFKQCPFNDVKVVIIGQDPYPNGNANGISFACEENVSPSLNQIFAAMLSQGFCKEPVNNRKSLEYLVKQGVLLYNTILTVEANKSLSHAWIGWGAFSHNVIEALNTKKDLVWLLWGNSAKDYVKSINSAHLILQAEHPAAAARNNRTWTCTHFAVANEYLRNRGLTEIKW